MPQTSVLLFDETPAQPIRPGLERRLIQTGKLMTVVLDIANGPWEAADPFHSHPHEQISYVAAGEILFLAEGDAPRRLCAGDLFAVPPGIPHAIQVLSKTVRLVDTFHPIREDFLP